MLRGESVDAVDIEDARGKIHRWQSPFTSATIGYSAQNHTFVGNMLLLKVRDEGKRKQTTSIHFFNVLLKENRN